MISWKAAAAGQSSGILDGSRTGDSSGGGGMKGRPVPSPGVRRANAAGLGLLPNGLTEESFDESTKRGVESFANGLSGRSALGVGDVEASSDIIETFRSLKGLQTERGQEFDAVDFTGFAFLPASLDGQAIKKFEIDMKAFEKFGEDVTRDG